MIGALRARPLVAGRASALPAATLSNCGDVLKLLLPRPRRKAGCSTEGNDLGEGNKAREMLQWMIRSQALRAPGPTRAVQRLEGSGPAPIPRAGL